MYNPETGSLDKYEAFDILLPSLALGGQVNVLGLSGPNWNQENRLIARYPDVLFNFYSVECDPTRHAVAAHNAQVFSERSANRFTVLPRGTLLRLLQRGKLPDVEFHLGLFDWMGVWSRGKRLETQIFCTRHMSKQNGYLLATLGIERGRGAEMQRIKEMVRENNLTWDAPFSDVRQNAARSPIRPNEHPLLVGAAATIMQDAQQGGCHLLPVSMVAYSGGRAQARHRTTENYILLRSE